MLRERGVSPIYNMPLQSLANTKLVRSPTLKGRKRAITDNDITSLGGVSSADLTGSPRCWGPSFGLYSPCW